MFEYSGRKSLNCRMKMTNNNSLVQHIPALLRNSPYPSRVFDYADDIFLELHCREVWAGIIENAIGVQQGMFISQILEIEIPPDSYVCIENIRIADGYRNRGVFTSLVKSFYESGFEYVVVSNVYNPDFLQWLDNSKHWTRSTGFGPMVAANRNLIPGNAPGYFLYTPTSVMEVAGESDESCS